MNILDHKPPSVSAAGAVCHQDGSVHSASNIHRGMGLPGDSVQKWRGHGGRHPTFSSVEFDRQLDKISMWLEKWSHSQRCQLIETILRRSNHIQFQFLFTVMQPSLHRDFIYNAQSYFPSMDFKTISTPAVREVQRRLRLHRQDNYYREKSAYIRQESEAKNLANETKDLKLPKIPTGALIPMWEKNRTDMSIINYKSKHLYSPFNGFPRIQQSPSLPRHTMSRASGELVDTTSLASSSPVMRFVDMPIRRHIQNEGKMQYVGKSLNSVTSHSPTMSMSSSRSSPRNKKTQNMFKEYTGRTQLTRENGAGFNISNRSNLVQQTDSAEGLDADALHVIQWYEDWSDLRRNEFLHKLLLKLDHRQHYFISSFLSVRQHRDFLALLPENIALKILNYLSPNKILKCCLVSKTWYRLASDNQLWEWKCGEREILVPVPQHPWWKKIFRDNVQLNSNWKTGSCHTMDLKGHTEQVEEIAFTHKLLASGSQDKTIKIWDLKTGHNLMTLRGHEKGVWTLNFFTDSLLVSGSYDGTIKIWNLRNGQTARTLLAHDGPVWAMVRHNETLVTTSQDKTAKVWNISHCLLKATLIGHNAAVFAVDMNEDGSIVITGSADRSVRLWDTETGSQKKVIWVSQTTSIMAVSYSKGYITCSYGETICLYRVDKPKLIRTFQEHQKRIEALELQIKDVDGDEITGTIISAGQDGMVKYWDVQQNASTRTFKGHVGSVKAIRFDNLRIATAATDKVRVWDFTFREKIEKPPGSEMSDRTVKGVLTPRIHSTNIKSALSPRLEGTPEIANL